MSESPDPYGVFYIASAPEEFKVGDLVQIVTNGTGYVDHEGETGVIKYFSSHTSFGVEINGCVTVYPAKYLRKIQKEICFDNPDDAWVGHFRNIANEMVETYRRKNADYGNAYLDGFNRFGAVQLVSRIYEKYCRIENLLVRKALPSVKDESVIDTLTDIANQCIILRMMLETPDVDFENVE